MIRSVRRRGASRPDSTEADPGAPPRARIIVARAPLGRGLAVQLAVIALCSAGGCKSEPSSRAETVTSLVIPWAAGQPSTEQMPRWSFEEGERWLVRSMEHVTHLAGDSEAPELAQLVERSGVISVLEASGEPGAQRLRLRLGEPSVVVRPAPGAWGDKLSRGLDGVEFTVIFQPTDVVVAIAGGASRASEVDAQRVAATIAMLLQPAPSADRRAKWTTKGRIDTGSDSALTLQLERALRDAGALPCGDDATCRSLAGELKTTLGGSFGDTAAAGSVHGEGSGTVLATVRPHGERHILDGIVLRYEERLDLSSGESAARRRIVRHQMATWSHLREASGDAAGEQESGR